MFADTLKAILTAPSFLVVWGLLAAASLAVVIYDLRANNAQTPSLMKLVWGFSVLYSGPLGLAVYFYSGRKQIARDSLWRRSFRSVAHCYSGCGGGEIVGVFIAAGLLGLGNWWIAGITFALAYAAGFALTVGPLVQDGVPLHQALWDAVYSETASITVMEIVAVSVDLWLAGSATMGDPIFWASLVFSLSMGLLAAYPVNVLLIHWGVKQGMHSPKASHAH
jgi:Domain of unknown function (DUF4396)